MLKRVNRGKGHLGFVLSLSAVFTILLIVIAKLYQINYTTISSFQKAFSEQERRQEALLKQVSNDWNDLTPEGFSKKYGEDEFLFIHVYKSDSLVYWNTNKCPINRFAEWHFPVNGLVKLQNGWYYTKLQKQEEYLFAVTFGIKRTFPISNKQLADYFFQPFPNVSGEVSQLVEKGMQVVYDSSGHEVFSVHFLTNENNSNFLHFTLFLCVILIWTTSVLWIIKATESILVLSLTACFLIIIRFISLQTNLFFWMEQNDLLDPTVVAVNQWVPNMLEVIVWSVFSMLLILLFIKLVRLSSNKLLRWFFLALAPCFMLLFPFVVRILIINSTIPINISNLLGLTIFSGILIFLIGSGCGILFLYYKEAFKQLLNLQNSKGWIYGFVGLTILLVLGVNEWVFRLHGFWIIWMFLIFLVGFLHAFYNSLSSSFSGSLLVLFVLAIGLTFNLEKEAQKKEKEERILLANQLADDRDMNAEVDFLNAKKKLLSEPFLKRLFKTETSPSFSELKEAMEYRVFNGYWDRYDVDFYFYRADSSHVRMNGFYKKQLDEFIQEHGEVSEIDSSLYFIGDYTSQFNYIFYLDLVRDGVHIDFYGTLRSKRIPEKIGFPRILVSKQTAVFELLESYSIAKYYNNQLVLNYGDFSFPTDLNLIPKHNQSGYSWNQYAGYNHLVFKKSSSDAIVLSKEMPSWLSYLTSTAFLMVCFGFVYLFLFFLLKKEVSYHQEGFSLVSKIQVTLIGLIIISLVGYGLASTNLLSEQNRSYSNNQIRDRVQSVINEINTRQRFTSEKFDYKKQEDLDYLLRRWSKVFMADINLYRRDGVLAGTSRSKIYNMGLLSEQMNPKAFYALHYKKVSEFIHEENIGKLVYLSGYVPVFNHDRDLLGYLNILHFDQRNAFEEQLSQFLVAIINVFMLLLVLSILAGLLATSWITKPLVLLKNSFSKVEFGKNNARIEYKGKDEIGALVTEYNLKLEELADAAHKLAQSERETAWREMAKQVAHEIKNPLTPMRLSVQHLQRVFDPSDPKAAERIERVSKSLIEQIDALTTIANEFSNFAKLPQPVMDYLDLTEQIEQVVTLFESSDRVTIHFNNSANGPVVVFADKELILRVLNNVVTNGIQAVPVNQKAQIDIHLSIVSDHVQLRISDNGTGIPEDQIQTIFEPYFTTKSTGTGLGLAMVKQIVETHRGTIEIEKTSSEGTTVLITFPEQN